MPMGAATEDDKMLRKCGRLENGFIGIMRNLFKTGNGWNVRPRSGGYHNAFCSVGFAASFETIGAG